MEGDSQGPSEALATEMMRLALRDDLAESELDESERAEFRELMSGWLREVPSEIEEILIAQRDLLERNLWVYKDRTIIDRLAALMVERALSNTLLKEAVATARRDALAQLVRLWLLGEATEVKVFLFDAYGL